MSEHTPDDWNAEQRRLYSKLYRFFIQNPQGLVRPGSAPIPLEDWNTIAHNAAYLAAELLEAENFEVYSDTDQLIATLRPHLDS